MGYEREQARKQVIYYLFLFRRRHKVSVVFIMCFPYEKHKVKTAGMKCLMNVPTLRKPTHSIFALFGCSKLPHLDFGHAHLK